MISVYLDSDVMKSLSAYVARREQSMSLIAGPRLRSGSSSRTGAWLDSSAMSESVSRRSCSSFASGAYHDGPASRTGR
jgi:hypothetical protein